MKEIEENEVKEEKEEKVEMEEKEEKEEKDEKGEKIYSLAKFESEDSEDKFDEFFKDKRSKRKIFRCTGDIMIGITYLGRIIITLYTFHGLFFIYNLIFQYIILFAGLLFDINGNKVSQIILALIYVLFSFSVGNILVIPTYEFLTFPFMSYRNPFVHLMSFAYIIKDIKFDTKNALTKNSNIVNQFLIIIEIVYFFGFLCVWMSITTIIKDYVKMVILVFVYAYYLTILICYFFLFLFLAYQLIKGSYQEYKKNKENNNIKDNPFKKYWTIIKNSLLDLNVFFGNRQELPDINLLSYIVNPFLIKNYEFKDGTKVQKKHMDDYCDKIGLYQKVLLVILSIIVFIILMIDGSKSEPSSIICFIFLFIILSTLSIGINFPVCFRNKKTFGSFFASTHYRYKIKVRHPLMISLIRFVCNSLTVLICFGLCFIFFFTSNQESSQDFEKLGLKGKPISKISSLTKDKLLPNMCFSSIFHIPIHYYIPFIVDAYYYDKNAKKQSSLQIEEYRRLFFNDDFEIIQFGDLIENNKTENNEKSNMVTMVQYNIKTDKDELTILSIKGTSYKQDIFLDVQLYFPSVLLNILSTFSLSQKDTRSNKLIEYSLSIPYRIFFKFLIINTYIEDLTKAYSNNIHNFHNNVIIVGHSLGGGLAKILGRFVKKQAISLSGPGMNAFNSLWAYEGNSEYFGISAIDLVPDMDLVPRVEVSGGTIYRITCIAGVFGCHVKERSLCESLIMCRHPNYREYCSKVAMLGDEEIDKLYNNTELNDFKKEENNN